MGAGPEQVVRAPAAGPPRNGLLATLGTTDDGDERWGNGFRYEAEGCRDGDVGDPCDVTSPTIPTNPDNADWEPFYIEAVYRCSTFGHGAREWEARARRELEAVTETQLGREFWTGNQAQASGWPNRWLASVESDDLSEAGPVALTHGLACLEQYLADHNGGQRGAIHATAQTVTHWVGLDLVERVNGVLVTSLDTLVIASPGYDGSTPDGNPASDGDVWAYATDMPQVRLGAVDVLDPVRATDRDANTVTVVARRLASVSFQKCRHAAMQLDMVTCAVGGS